MQVSSFTSKWVLGQYAARAVTVGSQQHLSLSEQPHQTLNNHIICSFLPHGSTFGPLGHIPHIPLQSYHFVAKEAYVSYSEVRMDACTYVRSQRICIVQSSHAITGPFGYGSHTVSS